MKKTKIQKLTFIAGIVFIIIGLGVLSVFGFIKVKNSIRKHKLLKNSIILEIPEIDIKTPVIEGTEQEKLRIAAGHFPETGQPGKGNYCVAGHSSTIYAEIFNNLKNIKDGMEIKLTDKENSCYVYEVSDSFIAEPSETWVLSDFNDNRITIITCTDDGKQRQIVVGMLVEEKEALNERTG